MWLEGDHPYKVTLWGLSFKFISWLLQVISVTVGVSNMQDERRKKSFLLGRRSLLPLQAPLAFKMLGVLQGLVSAFPSSLLTLLGNSGHSQRFAYHQAPKLLSLAPIQSPEFQVHTSSCPLEVQPNVPYTHHPPLPLSICPSRAAFPRQHQLPR